MSHPTTSRAALTTAALGVVFGDIGTSPLYALRECFHGDHGIPVTPENVMGVLSLIFWALILVISVKYISYVMRMDNHGEGGVLALIALIPSTYRGPQSRGAVVVAADQRADRKISPPKLLHDDATDSADAACRPRDKNRTARRHVKFSEVIP